MESGIAKLNLGCAVCPESFADACRGLEPLGRYCAPSNTSEGACVFRCCESLTACGGESSDCFLQALAVQGQMSSSVPDSLIWYGDVSHLGTAQVEMLGLYSLRHRHHAPNPVSGHCLNAPDAQFLSSSSSGSGSGSGCDYV
ncbi:hypothetical protein RRF57_003055 [Xylaria bambusicola]|uniref:Uncharacterized protein n=1 Tax=Xylaria bambusicola TaxID=326684 RepID=A0AAN7U845_9PEZI